MDSERGRRRWTFGIVGVVVVLIAGGVMVARRGDAGPPEIDPALLVTARRTTIEVDVAEIGKVQPREKVDIKSKVAGQVRSVAVSAGDRVKKGQLLMVLDPLDYRRQAERAAVDVAVARNALLLAQRTYNRRQKGLEEQGVAQADVEQAESDLHAKELALRQAQVAARAAGDQLHYTRIVAPMDGTVIERAIGPGEVVTPGVQATFEGRALLAIADLSTLVVKAEVNQIDVAKLAVGQRVTVTLDALPGRRFPATLTRIAPAAVAAKDKQVDVFPVEATLSHADPAIKPGMIADVRIHVDKRDGVLVLPVEAVVDQGGDHWITSVVYGPDGKAQRRLAKVTVGVRNDRDIEVQHGVEEGEQVLVRPPSAGDNELKL